MSECPYCHRHLLSHGSPNCNWCGREIPDAAYQQRAAVRREVFFEEQAIHDAISLARIEAINAYDPLLSPLDPLTGLPFAALLPPSRPLPPVPPLAAGRAPQPAFDHAYDHPYGTPEPPTESAPPEEEDQPKPESSGRFGHLEL